jgi:uncharacterized membrane protein YfcA
MAGALLHLFAAFVSALIVHLMFKNKNYDFAIFLGNLLPDMIGAAYASVLVGSLNPSVVFSSKPWFSLEKDTTIQMMWIIFQSIFIYIYLLFHTKLKIKHKYFEKHYQEIENILALLLLGFLTHMLMDIFIIESGFWY